MALLRLSHVLLCDAIVPCFLADCRLPVAKIDEVQPSGVARFARCTELSDGILSLESLKGGRWRGHDTVGHVFFAFQQLFVYRCWPLSLFCIWLLLSKNLSP